MRRCARKLPCGGRIRLFYVFLGGFVAADHYVEVAGCGVVNAYTLEVVVDGSG